MGLSIEQKYNICLMAEKHPKWTQGELAQWAYQVYQLPSKPSQGTISRLLAKKSEFMNSKEHEKDSSRLRRPNNLLVHRILQEWVSQSIWNGIPVSVPVIQDTAQSVWHKIPPKHREGKGSFSHKWVANFLSRMNLSTYIIDHGMPKPPKVWSFDERAILKDFISNIPPSELFTLDETFLAYNLPLDYAHYESNSIQKHLEVITVMLCANLDGTEKLDPMIIGRYENYSSFKNHFREETTISNSGDLGQDIHLGERMAKKFGVSYHSNKKSWLTSTLFHDWLVSWDKRLVSDDRKIWILLDDSCSHRIVNLHLQNIQLIYTSSNSRFLPFNWGVLEEFKTRYRIQQYKALIDLQSKLSDNPADLKLLSYSQSCLTMSNAFKFIKISWDAIPKELVQSNWKSSGILPPGMLKANDPRSSAFRRNSFLEMKLNKLCDIYRCNRKWDYSLLLSLNIENKNKNFLSLEEIIESSIVEHWETQKDVDALLSNDVDMLLDTFVPPIVNKSGTEAYSGSSVVDGTYILQQQPDQQHVLSAQKDQFQQNQQLPTVSQLIDNNTNTMLGTMLENDIFSAEILKDIFSTTPNMDDENSSHLASIVYDHSRSGRTPANDAPSMFTGTAQPNSTTSVAQQQTALQGLGAEELDPLAVSSYISETISNNAKATELSSEKLVMLTTLQSNVELAKAMKIILRHSEIREVGLSQSSLGELRVGYSNCVKKIRKAKHVLHSLEKGKIHQNTGKQAITSSSVTPEGSIESLGIENAFFSAFGNTEPRLNISEGFGNESPSL